MGADSGEVSFSLIGASVHPLVNYVSFEPHLCCCVLADDLTCAVVCWLMTSPVLLCTG